MMRRPCSNHVAADTEVAEGKWEWSSWKILYSGAHLSRLRAQGLTPIVEGILQRDMKRFAEYALEH